MADYIGRSREWVSRLENDNGEFSTEVMRLIEDKEAVIQQHNDVTRDHLNSGGLPERVEEAQVSYSRGVASRIPERRAPSTREDCENYFRDLMAAAELSDDPNAFPVLLHRLKKEFPFDEWAETKPIE
jgi:hypothetical protein